jgi:hypothetical protein
MLTRRDLERSSEGGPRGRGYFLSKEEAEDDARRERNDPANDGWTISVVDIGDLG